MLGLLSERGNKSLVGLAFIIVFCPFVLALIVGAGLATIGSLTGLFWWIFVIVFYFVMMGLFVLLVR